MAKVLWEPSKNRIRATNMYRFMDAINRRYGTDFTDYEPLYRWSVAHIPELWTSVWEFVDITASKPYDEVIDDVTKLPGARWFSGAELNFAQHLLRRRDEHTALISYAEGRAPRRMTYRQLYDEVARVAASLRQMGVTPGDRVAGFMPNIPETVIAMLAAASIGAVWSSCSPDFGIRGVLDRFGQTQPKVLFTADGYTFKGKPFDSRGPIADVLKELPATETVVVVPHVTDTPDIQGIPHAVPYEEFVLSDEHREIDFAQLPFEHPLYIMYTSGTTGLPKCMVQSAGGVLINQLKELVLHTDLTPEDTIFYFTTCGWMMWNWVVCSLAVGATVVLYDGNPFHPDPGVLWKMAQDEKVTIFGTSAGYIGALQTAGVRPGAQYDLSALNAVLSTGSPLSIEGFEYVYRHVKEDVQLASISGGSDINGCFAGGNPMGPVYAGELQCRYLGMKVEAYDEQGTPVINQQGELVCTAPSPSMPIYFWDDPTGEKYHAAYFSVYPHVWRHGDYVEINNHGGVVIFGRSDATLKPGGVRIGTAEIYRQVDAIDEVADSIVVGQEWNNDVRIILFVQMAQGVPLTEEVKDTIRRTIRTNASPRHVPAKIIAVPEIPYTLNMKKMEMAVKKIIQGQPVLNRDALRNPAVLDCYANLPELHED